MANNQQNVIEIIIRSVDELSHNLRVIEQSMEKMRTAADVSTESLEFSSRSTQGLDRSLVSAGRQMDLFQKTTSATAVQLNLFDSTVGKTARTVERSSVSMAGLYSQMDKAGSQGAGAVRRLQDGNERLARSSSNVVRSLAPLARGIGQVSGAAARLYPEIGIAVGSIDNLAFAMIRASAQSTSFSQALTAALRSAFNPVTLGVLALVTALGFLIKKLIEAREEKQKFDIAVATGNLGYFESELAQINAKLEENRKKQAEVRAEAEKARQPGQRAVPSTTLGAGATEFQRRAAGEFASAVANRQDAQQQSELNQLRKEENEQLDKRIKLEEKAEEIRARRQEEQVNAAVEKSLDALALAAVDVANAREKVNLVEEKAIIDADRRAAVRKAEIEAEQQMALALKDETKESIRIELVKKVNLINAQAGIKALQAERAERLRNIETLKSEISALNERAKLAEPDLDERRALDRQTALHGVDVDVAGGVINSSEAERRRREINAQFNTEEAKADQEKLDRMRDLETQIFDLTEAEKNLAIESEFYTIELEKQQKLRELAIKTALNEIQPQEAAKRRELIETEARLKTAAAQKRLDQQRAQNTAAIIRDEGITGDIGIDDTTEDIEEALIKGEMAGLAELRKEAEETAKAMASSLTDDFINQLQNKELTVQNALAAFGRVIFKSMVETVLQKILTELLINNVSALRTIQKEGVGGIFSSPIFQGLKAITGFVSGIGGLFGGLGGGGGVAAGPGNISIDSRAFAQGGIVNRPTLALIGERGPEIVAKLLPGDMQAISNGGSTRALQHFAKGGVVDKPTLGILGENGPEIVARMMPDSGGGRASQSSAVPESIQQRIFIVDDRKDVPALTPKDVILTIADDATRGGDASKAILNMVRLRS